MEEVGKKYGGEVDKYEAFSKTIGDKYNNIGELAKTERAAIQPLLESPNRPEDIQGFFESVARTFRQLPKQLQEDQVEAARFLKEKPANYKGVTESVQSSASRFSRLWGQIITQFTALKDDKKAQLPD